MGRKIPFATTRGAITSRNATLRVPSTSFSAMAVQCTKSAIYIHSIATRFGSIAAQSKKLKDEKTGFAFLKCKVTGTGPVYVGRALGPYATIVYSYTYFDDLVAHGVWDDVDLDPHHSTSKNQTMFFGTHKCWGPGAKTMLRASRARELDYDTAHQFLAKSFVNGRHWISPYDA